MALQIIGSPRSRTMRTLWAAAELQLEYEHLPWSWDDPRLKDPEFLDMNPAGAIPTIIDDGFALSESLSINLYLAKKYGHGDPLRLYPTSLEGEARVWRWSLWAQSHLEPWVQRDADLLLIREAAAESSFNVLQKSLRILDMAISKSGWLVNGSFTIADLNVAGVLSPSRAATAGVHDHRHVSDWLDRCYQRPAALAVRERFG
ncbi:MAG: glutathione S-transferase family protein [Phenylobacterium sp.]|uniref:glutathione S-transferase family protein n=1 Tax=Phenylobacterium sp. TaxID=1871053 RepID=UPI002715B3FC|nr:glutathione S-transferase family protein [Phenylobacterium sp.]MDO8409566.1 glutathione S-transferase family protein [Phenylobacterium sp.]